MQKLHLVTSLLHQVSPGNPCYVFQLLADPSGTRVAGASTLN
jgi:hypothetical protein